MPREYKQCWWLAFLHAVHFTKILHVSSSFKRIQSVIVSTLRFFADEECQRLGIKFIPPSRQKRSAAFGVESEGEEKKFSTNPEDSGDESDAESVDSFSDLYPGETSGRLWRGWMSDYRWRWGDDEGWAKEKGRGNGNP